MFNNLFLADHAQVIRAAGKYYQITEKACQGAGKAAYDTPGCVAAQSLIDEPEFMVRQFREQSLPQPELV
jgi:hypothetical protein